MGGPIVRVGQRMILPGVGFQVTSGEPAPDLADGVIVYVGHANRGPLNVAQRVFGPEHLARLYGPTGEAGNTMDGVLHAGFGGAVAVDVVRLGQPGAPAAVATRMFVDDSVAPGVGILRIDAKDVGTDGNNLTVAFRDNALDATKQDMVIYELGVQKEVHTTTPGADAAAAWVAQITTDGSDLIAIPVRIAAGTGKVLNVPASALAGGINPVVTNSDYATALALAGKSRSRAIVLDSEDPAVHIIARAGVDDLIMNGRRRLVVVGQATTITWSQRILNTLAVADPAVVFVGGAHEYQDTQGNWVVVAGHNAAAKHAGELSILPLGKQMTMRRTPYAQRIREGGVGGQEPSDDQLKEAVEMHMVVYSHSDTGNVVTLEGSTTYKPGDPAPLWADSVEPGWGKSRLELTRMRIFDALYSAWEPMIPDTSNTNAGRESYIREGKNVIETQFQPSGAVDAYSLTVASDPPPQGDEATFLLDIQTPDGLERLRLIGKFRR